jgi:hypothetical protein
MIYFRRVFGSVGAIALLVSFTSFAWADLTVQGYSPATAGMYDRFLNDPSFIGSGYNWSGVGRGINTVTNVDVGSWGTMISPSYFISANHFSPSAVGANALRFYYTNSAAGGFEDHTFAAVGRISNSDLWLGKLDTPVSKSIAKYPIVSMPGASYGGLPITIFGLSSPYPGTATSMRLGTNNIDVHNGINGGTPVTSTTVEGTTGYTYTFDYTANAGGGEAKLQVGDSAAPNFYFVNGSMPAVIGINWYSLLSPDGSGSTAVPKYLNALQAAMNEPLTIVKNSPVLGDYNLDGQLSVADLQALSVALTDLSGYKALHGITQSYLMQIGDLNGDLAISNADLQPLLNLLASGGGAGAIETVPEPASALLLALGALAFALKRSQEARKCQPNGTPFVE